MGKLLLIVGFGSVATGKYMRFIEDYLNNKIIDGYATIDLISQKEILDNKINKLTIKPIINFYLEDNNTGKDINHIKEFDKIIQELQNNKYDLKIFISTDPRFHEGYLEYCLDNNIDCLVEKPIITPVIGGKFNPDLYESKMANLFKKAKSKNGNFSVMSGARYHEIFNIDILDNIKFKMEKYKIPITSFHIRTSSGIWNLYNEFTSREDHPYKYGFGVLNHGAYHYLDVFAQCLQLNKNLLNEELELTINSFVAYPSDQGSRIPESIYSGLNGELNKDFFNTDTLSEYGETDIVTNFSLKNSNNKVIMLGTISLEHTTPCCRNWTNLDFSEYNKNGRLPCTDVEIQLSTLYSVHTHMIKKPENYLRYNADVLYRSNKELLNDEHYYYKKSYPDFEGKGKFILIKNWLEGNEEKSKLIDHELTMKILEKLSISIITPGVSVSFKI